MARGTRPRALRRGVYPLVVRLILVALVLVVTIAIVVYIRSLVTPTIEYFELGPRLYVSYARLGPAPVLVMYVSNSGARSETILRIEIVTGSGSYVCEEETQIRAGFRGYLVIGPSSSLQQGAINGTAVVCEWRTVGAPEIVGGHSYLVRVYTAYHGVMAFVLRCEEL